MPPTDRVRVFRIVEIVGTRERVEKQVRGSLHGCIALGARGRLPPGDPTAVIQIASTTLGEFPEVVPDHEERLAHAEGVLEKLRAFGRIVETKRGEDVSAEIHNLRAALAFYDMAWPRFEPRAASTVVTDENDNAAVAREEEVPAPPPPDPDEPIEH